MEEKLEEVVEETTQETIEQIEETKFKTADDDSVDPVSVRNPSGPASTPLIVLKLPSFCLM